MNAQRATQLVEAGLWLQMSGDVDGARRLFQQALKLDPENERARTLLEDHAATEVTQSYALPDNPFQRPSELFGSPGSQEPLVLDDPADDPAPPPPPPPRTPPPPQDPSPVTFAPDATSAWDSRSNPGVHISSVTPGLGDVMDMLTATPQEERPPRKEKPSSRSARSSVREELETLLRGARDLLELDDHTGAMDLIVKAQALAPNDPEVQQLRARSERTLQAMFESKLGEMAARPKVILKQDEIIWLNLDHRAGFVLAQIDGTVSFDDLFEVCGMSRLDTARILAQLIDEGVITV